MTTSEFLNEIDTIIQAAPGSTSLGDRLESLPGWDSMAIIIFIAMADEKLGISLPVGALASCKTVGDLAKQCEGKVS
jgi:acyl carrier protein